MFGKNPVAKARAEGFLVHSIFYTIQGEGPWAGRTTIFLRLAGCNLQCAFCDTEFTEGAYERSLYDLTTDLANTADAWNCRRVVITGGEPMLQPLSPLIMDLLALGITCQIETAGTVWPAGFHNVIEHVIMVVSPKTPKLNPALSLYWRQLVLKYIVIAGQLAPDGLPIGLYRRPEHSPVDILVQPCDVADPGQMQANMQETARSALVFGYRLSIQIHKIVGLP